jgi:hypothetical protein
MSCQPSTLPGAKPVFSGCTNTCYSSNNGKCDDGGQGSEFDNCCLSTDCNDCGARIPPSPPSPPPPSPPPPPYPSLPPPPGWGYGTLCGLSVESVAPTRRSLTARGLNQGGTCLNSCSFALDGDCDDGGWGAEYTYCPPCHDCTDCGERLSCNALPPPMPQQGYGLPPPMPQQGYGLPPPMPQQGYESILTQFDGICDGTYPGRRMCAPPARHTHTASPIALRTSACFF